MVETFERTGLAGVLDALPEPVLVVRPRDSRLLYANAAAQTAGADRWWTGLPLADFQRDSARQAEDGADGAAIGPDLPPVETAHPAAADRWLSVYRRGVLWQPNGCAPTAAEPAVLLRLTDITGLRRQHERIHQLSQAVEQSPGAVMITDTAGDIVYVNRAFERISGYGADEAVGRNPRFLKSGHTSREEYQRMWQTLAGGGIWHGRTRNRRKDGSYYWEETTISPLRLPGGTITHYIALKQDITERNRAEQELRLALFRAEEANRAKSAFLSTMSHELRTPLNAIIGFSDMIRHKMFGDAIDSYVRYADDIYDSGQRLGAVIGDILDMAKLESGRYRLAEEKVDVSQSVAWVLPLVEKAAGEAGVRLCNHVGDDLPSLWADPLAVRQVLLNVIGNAIKFTEPGGEVHLSAGLDEHGHMTLSVRDTGIGIPEDALTRVLEPFQQADMRLARSYEGTGLGLTISRSFMELHGGSLALSSRVGEGTTVTLRFPRERVQLKMSA